MSINNKYSVEISNYAKRHFIKSFEKKHKQAWIKTNEAIFEILSRIEIYGKTSKVNKIHINDNYYIAKVEFNIAWQKTSSKKSWNRIIVYVDEINKKVYILLLYSKKDIKWSNETTWWEQEIKNNCLEIKWKFTF